MSEKNAAASANAPLNTASNEPANSRSIAVTSAIAENARLAATLDAVGDALIVTDASARVVLLNAQAQKITGWTSAQALGQFFSDVVKVVDESGQPPCPVIRVLERHANAGASRCVTIQVRAGESSDGESSDGESSDGESVQIEGSAAPQFDGDGNITGAIFVFRDISERETARLNLWRSTVRYESLIEAISQMVWTATPNGHAKDIPLWREYTGQTRDEIVGWGWLDAIHPDDQEHARQVWQNAVETRGFYQVEYRVRHRNGSYRLFLARGVPVLENGEVREWVGVCNDIDERKKAESLLSGQRRVLEMIAGGEPLQTTLDALAHLIEAHSEAQCSIYLVDENRAQLRNVSAPSLPIEYSMRFRSIPIADGSGSCGTAAARREMVVTQDIENDALWRDAASFALSVGLRSCWSMPIMKNDQVFGTFAMYHREPRRPQKSEVRLFEVAVNLAGIAIEREKNQADLLLSLAREAQTATELASILARITDGVITADANGVITFENEAARSLHGFSLLGRNLRDDIGPIALSDAEGRGFTPDRWPLYRAVFKGEEVSNCEMVFCNADGREIGLDVNAVPVHDENGQQVGAVLTIHDTSTQRQLIREMLEANRSKDEFLAILSHELRTPLTPILGWASLLRQTGGQDPEMFAQAVDAIERNAQLQKRLVNDLLDTTRIVTDKLRIEKRAANLNELVKLSVHSVLDQANDADVEIEYSIDERLPLLQMDTERIQQVLVNLLSNAVKFSSSGSCVKLRTLLQARRFDEANSGTKSTQFALIEIEDRGQGISPELLPHVFDLFRQGDSSFTRRHGGLGLGLAICKSLVEMHGGTVQAISEGLGRGAIFRVLLPIEESAGV